MVNERDLTASNIVYDDYDIDELMRIKGYYEDMPIIEDVEGNYPLYIERLHPRKDYQRKPFWLRIRSNPFRANYH